MPTSALRCLRAPRSVLVAAGLLHTLVTMAATPVAFRGDWLVTQVAVDQVEPRSWVFRIQDPFLLNRVMTLDAAVDWRST